MKRFLGASPTMLILAILLGLSAQAHAQAHTEAIYYTKLAKNSMGLGDRIFYDPANDGKVDSVYAYFLVHNTVAGYDVFSVTRVHAEDPSSLAWGPYTSQDNQQRPIEVLDAYKTGNVIANASVTGGLVNIGSGVSTTFDTTGIVGVAVGPDTMITVTVPANAWADGQPLIVKLLYDGNFGDTMSGAQILRTQIAITGATTLTFDSSFGFAGVVAQCPYTLEFTRVGSQIWFTPALYHFAQSSKGFGLGAGGVAKNNIGQLYWSYFSYDNTNGANGAKFTGIDFTQPIQIKWIMKWTTGHGGGTHGGNNTQVRMRSAGAMFLPLQ